MMEKRRWTMLILVVVFMAIFIADAMADTLLSRLDEAISERDRYVAVKTGRIDSLRNRLNRSETPEERLEVCNALFKEYLAFSFDSAMLYVDKAEKVASAMENYDISSQVRIHRALSLATSGHFSHAMSLLTGIDSRRLSMPVREEYFSACEWTYGVWAEYADKQIIAPELIAKSIVYLDSLIAVTEKGTPEYDYRIAEKNLRTREYGEAERNYLAVLARVPIENRLYAQAAYALALTYKATGNKEKYRQWLINAAVSDQMVPLKENLALQELALFIKKEDGDISKANDFLKIALEDAVFFNNRLRMLEIAEKMPEITNVYQSTIEEKNKRMKWMLFFIGILMLALCCVVYMVWRQHERTKKSKEIVDMLNGELTLLNQKLSRTNTLRERYVSLFMDLCVAYIDKLNRFPMVLKLKVKQVSDVSSVAERYVRPSEAEAKEMFFNFDSAFLRLYPDFISQFNSLLREGEGIEPKQGEMLNTDLRIYALVRMGITDSNKIATLLFLSPQTIFNHRTKVRNKAKDREAFESAVSSLCQTAPDAENECASTT